MEAQPKKENSRPAEITIVSILMIVGTAPAITIAFSPLAQMISPWYPAYVSASALVGLACAFGLLKMKRLAAYCYIILTVFQQCILLFIGRWDIPALLFAAIFVAIVAKNMQKMS